MSTSLPHYRFLLLSSVLVVLDQITKLWVKNTMFLGESHPMIGETVRLTFVENPGMAFGIEFGAGKIVLTLVTIVVAGFLVWYLMRLREAHWSVQFAVCLILAGAVGNLIDRAFYGVIFNEDPLFFGKVVDFIQVDIPDITWFGERYTHWPVFNVADSCVSVGVVTLLFVSHKLPTKSNEQPGTPPIGTGQDRTHA